jgi:hypothetical protein
MLLNAKNADGKSEGSGKCGPRCRQVLGGFTASRQLNGLRPTLMWPTNAARGSGRKRILAILQMQRQ